MRRVINKLLKDNIGVLAAIISWNVLTSLVPIAVGLIAITGFVLRGNPGAEQAVVSHLSSALQGVLSTQELTNLVHASVTHAGLLGIIAIAGILWSGANIGGAIATVFQAIFEVNGRFFLIEKIVDVIMIFIFAVLMIVIIAATSAGSVVKSLISGFPLSGLATFVIGTAIAVSAAFVLFALIYVVFPNAKPRFTLANVWKGALVAAILFEILTYIFPIYAKFAHFSKDGKLLGTVVLLTAWIYFFSLVLVIGAEVVAITAINEAQSRGQEIGPMPENSVPQHSVLRQSETQKTA